MPISKLLSAAIVAGCLFAAAALIAGVMADDYPPLDIFNNGLPLLAAGLLVLFLLSLSLRTHYLSLASGGLLVMALLAFGPTQSGAAHQTSQDAKRFMRITTFNLQGKSSLHLQKVKAFLAETDPDAVILEEVRWKHEEFLKHMKAPYPYQAGGHGLVILSKHAIVDKGRIDRTDEPCWRSLIVNWARLNVNGTQVDLVGTHMARPFYPIQQETDFETLTSFVLSRTGPVIIAGDFNATPWTHKIKQFSAETGLARLNTFAPTWPARWKTLPLLPLLPIDNIFVSPHLAKIDLSIGPRLDSDHLPVIADVALVE